MLIDSQCFYGLFFYKFGKNQGGDFLALKVNGGWLASLPQGRDKK